jgi:electron transfer flavoprotein alpha subunit
MSKDIYVLIEHLREQVADISYIMLAAARGIAAGTGGTVVGILIGHNVQGLADGIGADRVLYIDDLALADFTSDGYQRVVENLLAQKRPRAFLFGDTSMGGDVAGWLSAHLSLPLVSHCRDLQADGETIKFVSQVYGGKILVEGALPSPTAIVMMVPGGYKAEQGKSAQTPEMVRLPAPALDGLRISVKNYIEPAAGDVDISKEGVLVSVGRGIQNQDNMEMARDLAKALGGEVAGSRPVIDQGWLPSTRLVGKSGKSVKPSVYLALGISGAPEHVEAIGDSEMIIAINTDPQAPIFDIAKYGSQVDLLDLLPVLTEKVTEAKGG